MSTSFDQFHKENSSMNGYSMAVARKAWVAGYGCGCDESYDAGWDDGYEQGFEEGLKDHEQILESR